MKGFSKGVNSPSDNLQTVLNSNWIFEELAKHILICTIKLINSYIEFEKE